MCFSGAAANHPSSRDFYTTLWEMTLSGSGDALQTNVSITIPVFKLGRKWQNVNSQEEKVCKQKYSFFFW